MHSTISSLSLLLATITALPAVTVDFNQITDLEDNFVIHRYNDGSGQQQDAANTSSGGISNSGAVGSDIHINSQALIYKQGFTLEQGSTYTVSTFFKGIAYNGVGFTRSLSEEILYLPEVSISYLGAEAGNLYVTNYATNDHQDWQWSGNALANYTSSDWIRRELSLTYNGNGEFYLSYATHISNAEGVLGELADEGSFTFINDDLTGTLYAFIFRDQSTEADMYIDDFTAFVPEPSTYAALAAACVLGIVILRRRSR